MQGQSVLTFVKLSDVESCTLQLCFACANLHNMHQCGGHAGPETNTSVTEMLLFTLASSRKSCLPNAILEASQCCDAESYYMSRQ